MQDTSPDFVSAVNHVISVCKDAQEGFEGAAEAVKNPQLSAMFREYSSQRSSFASELEAALSNLGAKADHPSGVAGKLHSGWMALKGALTGHSSHQILEETERGEDLSLKRYQDALAHQLPEPIRVLLERQYKEVQEAHNRIRGLRDTAAIK